MPTSPTSSKLAKVDSTGEGRRTTLKRQSEPAAGRFLSMPIDLKPPPEPMADRRRGVEGVIGALSGTGNFFEINRCRDVGAGSTAGKLANRWIFMRKIRTSPDIYCVAQHPPEIAYEIGLAERPKMRDWCTSNSVCDEDVHFFVRDIFLGQHGQKYWFCGFKGLTKWVVSCGWWGRNNCILECSPSRTLTSAEWDRVDEIKALVPWVSDDEDDRRIAEYDGITVEELRGYDNGQIASSFSSETA